MFIRAVVARWQQHILRIYWLLSSLCEQAVYVRISAQGIHYVPILESALDALF